VSHLVLRAARFDKAEQISKHVNACYRGDSSRQGWTTEADLLGGNRTDHEEISDLILSQNSEVLLCLGGQELVASVHLKSAGEVAELGMLAINPAIQGRGVGKWFLAEIERYVVQTWGAGRIRMAVITVREELIAFYERRGYKRTGLIKPFDLDERNGIPRQELEFEILQKELVGSKS